MGIDVRRETERGDEESVVHDPNGTMALLLNRRGGRELRLIQFIDPYGDTVFNQLQIPLLFEELKRLEEIVESDQERTFLKEVLDLVDGARDHGHTYVKFYGD